MVLGPEILLKLVNDKNIRLVENLSLRELKKPEGAGFDLRLGQVHKIAGDAYMGIRTRRTANYETVAKYEKGKRRFFTFRPGEQFLVTTIERVNLPKDLTANMWMRSTLYRSGMILSGGNVAPGYKGELSFTFFNSGEIPVKIALGARVVHILFYQVMGGGNLYEGQWQGGRVVAASKERQI